jgi:hypothetical protein
LGEPRALNIGIYPTTIARALNVCIYPTTIDDNLVNVTRPRESRIEPT